MQQCLKQPLCYLLPVPSTDPTTRSDWEAVTNKAREKLKMEENKIKLTALKTTTNIYMLIKDLYHQLPYYKANISLSWKPTSSGGKVVTNGMEK